MNRKTSECLKVEHKSNRFVASDGKMDISVLPDIITIVLSWRYTQSNRNCTFSLGTGNIF